MDIEILFTAFETEKWQDHIESGQYEPEEYLEDEIITCVEGKDLNQYLNSKYSDFEGNVTVLVLDPLRIQSPMKRKKNDHTSYILLTEPFSLDAVIDKIKLKKSVNSQFDLKVSHYD